MMCSACDPLFIHTTKVTCYITLIIRIVYKYIYKLILYVRVPYFVFMLIKYCSYVVLWTASSTNIFVCALNCSKHSNSIICISKCGAW